MFRFKTLALIALIALIAAPVMAADQQDYRVTNNSGAPAKDLHLTFTGTGGDISNTLMLNTSFCGTPTLGTSGGNTVDYDWGTDCLPAGGVVIVRVNTANGPLAFSSGTWTYQSASPVAVGAGDVVQVTVPTVTQWGLIVMTLLLLTAATIIFARRKPAAKLA